MDSSVKTSTHSKNKHFKEQLKVIYSAVAWGTMGLFARYIDLPSSVIACVRGFVGALFLYLIVVGTNRSLKLNLEKIKENLLVLIASGTALGINWILLFEAYRKTSVAIATLCYYMAPIAVMLTSTFIYKEKMTKKKAMCIGLALIGMVMISGVLSGNVGNGYGVIGMLLALGAACFYATVSMLGKKTVGLSAYDETIVKLLVAAVILVPYNMITVERGSMHPTPFMLIMLALLGITHTGIAFGTYFSAIHKLPMQTVAILTYLDPIVAVLISAFILHESMNPLEIIGAIILIGTLIYYDTDSV